VPNCRPRAAACRLAAFVLDGPMLSFLLNGSIRQGLAMVFALQALAVDAQGLET